MSLEKNLDLPEFILRMGKPSSQEVYEFDDFRLDAGHLMLYHKEEEVALVPKAAELLIALVERRGEIISKDELLEKVWPDAIVEESNLFFYLSILRKTLGTQKNGKPWFQTLRRRGYKFSGEVRVVSADGDGIPVPPRPVDLAPANTPGFRDDARTVDTRDERPLRIGRSVYAAAGLIVVALAATVAFQYLFERRPIKSIAVMPIGNENPELMPLSDGMTMDLIGSLSKVPDLDAKASSTMFTFKGTNLDAAAVGRTLEVEAVLSSRMVESGEDLALYVELVDSLTANVLWQETYRTKTSKLSSLQRNVIRDVVRELSIDVTDSTKQRLAKDYSESPEATELYLRGQYHIRRLTEPEIRKGLDYLRQATQHDPQYARAYAAIAMGIRSMTLCCDGNPSAFVEAKDAAQRAVELDDDLAEAHTALASILYQYDWKFDEAEKHYVRAIEINPNSGIAHFLYADFIVRIRTDRRDEADTHRKRALELEPYSAYFNAFAFGLVEPDKVLEKVQFTINLDPDAYFSHLMAAGVYSKKGMYSEAIEEYRIAKDLAPEQTWSDIFLSRLYKDMGQVDQSRAILNAMVERSKSHYVPPFHLAQMYSQVAETEKVIHYLEEGYRVRDPKMPFLNTIVSWGGAENDPRFQNIRERVGLPEKAKAAEK